MKKYTYIIIGVILVGLVVWWRVASASIVTVDSYSESNQNTDMSLDNYILDNTALGQSFTNTNSVTLDSVKFYILKNSLPTGNATVSIYAHTGVYGSASLPTGSALATSDTFDVSTLTTSHQLKTFTFSGVNRIALTSGTYYVVMLNYGGDGNTSHSVSVGVDSTSPTASGNLIYTTGGITYAWGVRDTIFYVYGDNGGSAPTLVAGSGQKMLMSSSF